MKKQILVALATLLVPVLEQALYILQQRRKQMALKAGLTGFEVKLFMLLAAPSESPELSQDQQSALEEV